MRILLVSEYSTANGDVDVACTFGGKFENCRPACLLCVTHSCCRWLLFVGGLKLGIGYGLRKGGGPDGGSVDGSDRGSGWPGNFVASVCVCSSDVACWVAYLLFVPPHTYL